MVGWLAIARSKNTHLLCLMVSVSLAFTEGTVRTSYLSSTVCGGLSWKSSNAGGWNHHGKACKFGIWRLLSAGGLAAEVSWKTITCSHGIPRAVDFLTAWCLGSEGKWCGWGEKESQVDLYYPLKQASSVSVLSLTEVVTEVHLHSRGGNIDPCSPAGWGCFSVSRCEHVKWAIY